MSEDLECSRRERQRSLRERSEARLNDPHLIDDIIAHVSQGGSLIELCRIWDVFFHRINTWVYEKHKDKYEQALKSSTEYLVQRVRDELKAIATVDLRLAYDETGKLKHPKDWPDDLCRVIASVDVMEEWGYTADSENNKNKELLGYTKKVKLWDKLKALELLGKNLSMFVDKHEISGKVTLEDLVNASMKPAEPAPTGTGAAPA